MFSLLVASLLHTDDSQTRTHTVHMFVVMLRNPKTPEALARWVRGRINVMLCVLQHFLPSWLKSKKKAILIICNVCDFDVRSDVLWRRRHIICCADKDASELPNANIEVCCLTTSVTACQSFHCASCKGYVRPFTISQRCAENDDQRRQYTNWVDPETCRFSNFRRLSHVKSGKSCAVVREEKVGGYLMDIFDDGATIETETLK